MTTQSTDNRLFLGQHGVVAKLIEDFSRDITAIFDEQIAGGEGGPKAEQAIVDRCAKIADVFKGRNPDYTLAPWRSDGRLEGKIVGWFHGKIRGDGDVILEFFKYLALQIVRACRAVHEGMAHEQAGPMLRSTLNDAVEKLAGIQP